MVSTSPRLQWWLGGCSPLDTLVLSGVGTSPPDLVLAQQEILWGGRFDFKSQPHHSLCGITGRLSACYIVECQFLHPWAGPGNSSSAFLKQRLWRSTMGLWLKVCTCCHGVPCKALVLTKQGISSHLMKLFPQIVQAELCRQQSPSPTLFVSPPSLWPSQKPQQRSGMEGTHWAELQPASPPGVPREARAYSRPTFCQELDMILILCSMCILEMNKTNSLEDL